MRLRIEEQLVKIVDIASPNSPGGRLMLWITSRSTLQPVGRSSAFGDGSA